MRICYLCADSGVRLSKYNGSAAHVRSLVQAFVELGHEVDLILPHPDEAEQTGARVRAISGPPFARALAGLARESRRLRADGDGTRAMLRALRRVWLNGAVEQLLGDELMRRRPDLVYERCSPFGVAGAVVARRLQIPHVLEVNAPLAWEGARHRGQALNEAAETLEHLAFAASTRIVVVSDELRAGLIDAGVEPAKVHVVPNGVDVRRFTPDGPRLPAGLDGKIVIGFVGSLKAWHGIEVLAEAFGKLAADPRLHLLVVGEGPRIEVVERLQRRLPQQVTLTGAVPPRDVPAYLRRIDVALAPYPPLDWFYFSPIKVLEYMASATAVVASRIGQLELLLRDGETGLLVEPGNARALAAAVRRLADEPRLRETLGRQAAELARREHGWEQRAAEILEVVRTAV